MKKTHLSHVADEAGLTIVERAVLITNSVYRWLERVEQGEPLLLEDLFEKKYDAPTAFYGLVKGIVTTLLPPEMYAQLQEEGEVEALQLRVQPYYWRAMASDGNEATE